MENQIIKSFLDAEKSVEETIFKAKDKSLKMISLAEEQAEDLKQKNLEETRESFKKTIKKTEKSAQEELLKMLEKYKNISFELEEKSKKNFEKASKILIKKVIVDGDC